MKRRNFIRTAVSTCLATVGALNLAACKGKSAGLFCASSDMLTRSESALRESLAYVDTTEQGDRHCSGCQFFVSGGEGACGTCQILSGPANPQGTCTSWSAA